MGRVLMDRLGRPESLPPLQPTVVFKTLEGEVMYVKEFNRLMIFPGDTLRFEWKYEDGPLYD